jgi:hypothetical protein
MDEQTMAQQEVEMRQPLRTYYGDERRCLFPGDYDGVERRIPDPLTEQDWYTEPPAN